MKESRGARETSISEFTGEFQDRISFLEKKYRVVVQIAEIQGRRWSYLGGSRMKDIPIVPPGQIRLNDRLGIVVYNWHRLPEERKKTLLSELKKILGVS